MDTTPETSLVPLYSVDHVHDSSCWWDHREARRVCPSVTIEPDAPTDGTDVRDMIVVHTAMLREFRLAPDAVRRAQHGSPRQVRCVVRHVGLMNQLLHHHHAGEDALLWPVLAPRLSPAERSLVAAAEAQHAGIERGIADTEDATADWAVTQDDATTARLTGALEVLHELLREHLEAEERYLLPLASAHLSQQEWSAIGEAGAAGVPKSAMLVVFGMFAYEGDPAVVAEMLHAAPPPVRVVVRRLAPRAYARYAARVHGTPLP